MERRFFYHAFGVGVGGRITRPCCEVIEAQAATALPSVGGYGSSHVDSFRFKDIVSVRSARAYVVGSRDDDNRSLNTSVTVTVEGLNILDVITADVITARLASRHSTGDDEPVITAVGSEFRNLRIGGELVNVQINCKPLFEERPYSAFKDESKQKRAEPWLVSKDGQRMLGSIFTPHEIDVPSVGKVFLGEILLLPYSRRLTMVRVALGSPVDGDAELASGEINGTTYP